MDLLKVNLYNHLKRSRRSSLNHNRKSILKQTLQKQNQLQHKGHGSDGLHAFLVAHSVVEIVSYNATRLLLLVLFVDIHFLPCRLVHHYNLIALRYHFANPPYVEKCVYIFLSDDGNSKFITLFIIGYDAWVEFYFDANRGGSFMCLLLT